MCMQCMCKSELNESEPKTGFALKSHTQKTISHQIEIAGATSEEPSIQNQVCTYTYIMCKIILFLSFTDREAIISEINNLLIKVHVLSANLAPNE